MLKRICLGLALLAGIPVWAQSPSATETPMELPPPVTGQSYPAQVGSDVRHNFVNVALTGGGGYADNVLAGFTNSKTGSGVYSLSPSITYNKNTARTAAQFNYNPAFSFYSEVSELNEFDQNAVGSLQYRITPHFVFRMQDAFTRSSSVFGMASGGVGGAVSSGSPTLLDGVVAQFADRIVNTATVDLALQASENTLIGGEGSFAQLDYPKSEEVPGLVNSNSVGGSGFYTHRVTAHQYIGFIYQYLQILTYLSNAEGNAALNTFSPFYSFYLLRTKQGNLTASLQGGLEHSSFVVRNGPLVTQWTPAISASIGWQGPITNFAVGYGRSVSGGGGLNGLYGQTSYNGMAQWRVARAWEISAGASYSNLKNDSPAYNPQLSTGHTVSGSADLTRTLGRSASFSVVYSRIHQSYPGVSTIELNPDSNRVYGSVSYQFSRPVGR
ncbi:MAG: hypothetical protein WBW84_01215 [Acidobacteriaceae bacterium]